MLTFNKNRCLQLMSEEKPGFLSSSGKGLIGYSSLILPQK